MTGHGKVMNKRSKKEDEVIWVCDRCGKKCKSDFIKHSHIMKTGHKIFTPIPVPISVKYQSLAQESDKKFRDWAEKVARTAMGYQDKTFRQLVEEKLIPSWAEYLLSNT